MPPKFLTDTSSFVVAPAKVSDEEDDASEDSELVNFQEKVDYSTVKVQNAVIQTWVKTETFFVPFVLNEEKRLHFLWYKPEKVQMEFVLTPEALKITITILPIPSDVLAKHGIYSPMSLNPIKSEIAIKMPCKVLHNTFNGKFEEGVLRVTIEKDLTTQEAQSRKF